MEEHAGSLFIGRWKSVGLTLLVAVVAQVMLSPKHLWVGLGLYLVAICSWLYHAHLHPPLLGKPIAITSDAQPWELSNFRRVCLLVCLVATCINVMLTWGKDTFTWGGVVAWGVSLFTFWAAFWEKPIRIYVSGYRLTPRGIYVTWTGLCFVLVLLLGIVFRIWHLPQVPPEMTWDHTQKLLDIRDVVEGGLRPLFFYRNTGREPLQFYWTAVLIWITHHPIDFTILKIGTVIAGVLTLPAIYLFAREMYGNTVGLWAMGFAAVSNWPVILSRTGLRYPFAPLFSAWSFYYLVRGLRRGERESFLLLGLCLGLGLYGYTAFRLIPLVVGYLWLVLRMAERSGDLHTHLSWRNFGLVIITALLVFVPLGTFAITHSWAFWNRSAWYLKDPAGFVPLIYFNNLKNALLMFNWRGDFMPLTTLPYQPVLDPIIGGLFVLGVASAIQRIMRKEESLIFALILLGISALLPSVLAINYPDENPSVVRTSCAIPIVFTLAALPIGIWTENISVKHHEKHLKAVICVGFFCLIGSLIAMNGRRVFVDYPQAYRTVALNTSEVAHAIRCFDEVIGDRENVYIIAGPGWIDSDALAFELRLPIWQNTLENASMISSKPNSPQMYILHLGNKTDLHILQSLFPMGWMHTYVSQYSQDFLVYIVPDSDMISNGVPEPLIQKFFGGNP